MILESWTEDKLLNGLVTVLQPRHGYRAAIDPVLLAAAVPARSNETILELGSGTGVASLCLAARLPEVHVTGLELQQSLIYLAQKSTVHNGLGTRVSFELGDILTPPNSVQRSKFDHVMANPPYMAKGSGFPPSDQQKAWAHVEGNAVLSDWIALAKTSIKSGGTITFIQRADREKEITSAFSGGAWHVIIYPLWPNNRAANAKRVIVHARSGDGAATVRASGLMLHGPSGRYTKEADAILRECAPIKF